jgi:hypothetical protein
MMSCFSEPRGDLADPLDDRIPIVHLRLLWDEPVMCEGWTMQARIRRLFRWLREFATELFHPDAAAANYPDTHGSQLTERRR